MNAPTENRDCVLRGNFLNIWLCNKSSGERWNMRCHYDKSMFPEVRRAVQLYIRWLKRHYYLGDKISLYLIIKYRI